MSAWPELAEGDTEEGKSLSEINQTKLSFIKTLSALFEQCLSFNFKQDIIMKCLKDMQ